MKWNFVGLAGANLPTAPRFNAGRGRSAIVLDQGSSFSMTDTAWEMQANARPLPHSILAACIPFRIHVLCELDIIGRLGRLTIILRGTGTKRGRLEAPMLISC
jgi:hypothetical protein